METFKALLPYIVGALLTGAGALIYAYFFRWRVPPEKAALEFKIEGEEPITARPGAVVTLSGQFGPENASCYVQVGSRRLRRAAGVISWTPTQISFRAPDDVPERCDIVVSDGARTASRPFVRESSRILMPAGVFGETIVRYIDGELERPVPKKLSPDPFERLLEQGRKVWQERQFQDALSKFEEALKLRPDSEDAWYGKAFCLGELGNHAGALDAFTRLSDIDPTDSSYRYNIGVSLQLLGRHEEALASYDKALQFEPDLAEAWCNKGVALGKLGRHEEALASHDKALELVPKLAAGWYNRSRTFALLERRDEALRSLATAIELDGAWKRAARENPDFAALRGDPEFERLTKE